MAQGTSRSAAQRSTVIRGRGAAVLGAAAALAGGCGVDFKVAVTGLPVEPSVSALLVSVDSGDRRADSASPLELSGFTAAQRADFADRFTFPLDVSGLLPVSKNARISVAALRYSDGKPCIHSSGGVDAMARSDNPTYAEVVVPLLPPVPGQVQDPTSQQLCGKEGPLLLGVRRELSGTLSASLLKLYINGWGFGLTNKVTIERCDVTLSGSRPICSLGGGSGAAIDGRFYRVDSIGKASIEVTFLPTFSEQSAEAMLDLLAIAFPLRITVEPLGAAGQVTGRAVYIEPELGFVTQ